MTQLETDYLIIGAGAVGLAFADTLIEQDPDCDVIIVDRHGAPGGHWNDAYGFVALHQPSAFYGVNSLELGSRRIDEAGHNKGFYELASGPEVSGYFHKVMHQQLLPSGRVRYFPMSEYHWPDGEGEEHRFTHLLSGEEQTVTVRKRLVDATYYGTSVPSTHKRKYAVADDVHCVPPNDLPQLWKDPDAVPPHFCILGAGKTAMDVGVWLLQAGASPDSISWVVPRDSWLLNRACTQPGIEFFEHSIGGQAALMQALAEAENVTDLFHRLEDADFMLRIDPEVEPGMFHYATISKGEVEILQQITDVIREGRVESIDAAGITFANGEKRAMPGDTLYVDCTATAVEFREPEPMYQPGKIVLQIARIPQPAFSAALCAFIEANYDDDKERNRLTMPVPLPDTLDQYPAACMGNLVNQMNWTSDGKLRDWLLKSRLDGFSATIASIGPDDHDKIATMQRFRKYGGLAAQNIPKLIMQAQAAKTG
ncbi:NAD(P)-binding protein [Alterisphingorhabdus coralli]|uniref:NAD(P)-binding protein n=1 Tax=Alterisphingorhabdus coralli TaxID=3071408 RepID=A0AA97I2F6_9SPHN|nr:NAD(P)-binding protein [Parasphingorhabdus sp. SCSIO 66989]WOE76188.1 NAD(P)-binding protein [Parasphingorhabdus sp. SCSIO 66989]